MKKQWKNIIEVEPDGKRGMYKGAWCLTFVYSNQGNFLIKGYHRETEEYLNKLKQEKGLVYFCNYRLLCKTSKRNDRSIWSTSNNGVMLSEPLRSKSKYYRHPYKWRFSYYNKDLKERDMLTFRRLPKKMIPEIYNFLKS